MSSRPRALIVDDDAGIRFTLRDVLESAGLEVSEAADGREAIQKLGSEPPFHVVLMDLRMPHVSGLDLLKQFRATHDGPRVIMITAHGSERHAVEAMKAGAYDYFRKPFEIDEVLAVVLRAVESVTLRAENERLSGELNLARSMVFGSPAMSRLALAVQRVAPRDVTVLITGESGTGKERVAEALVRASKRAEEPFVRFNCAALTPELAEAELFGHTRGAFTGAQRPRLGLFREAERGTILLDEIGELDLALQAKLLRVLQEREVRPVGDDRAQPIDVRVLASTHRDLREMVQRGAFREDLFYRLNVVPLRVPPLRERPEDVPLLVDHFFARLADRFGITSLRVPPEVKTALASRVWPGNVRELENTVESLVALSHDGEIDLTLLDEHIPPSARGPANEIDPNAGLRERVESFERTILIEALAKTAGNQAEAARLLRIGRATLHDKLRKYRLT
ncbi:MAG: Response regulator of zinc sigma-54-dependent two-component system [Labilithrix sp.]|nr:Response regulator of zinc sigma-54-dependent two-component system [Labilithrix sp.]